MDEEAAAAAIVALLQRKEEEAAKHKRFLAAARQKRFKEKKRAELGEELHKKLHAVAEKNRYIKKQVIVTEQERIEKEAETRKETLAKSDGSRRQTRLQTGAIEEAVSMEQGEERHLLVTREGGCAGMGVMAMKDYGAHELVGEYKGKILDEKGKKAALRKGVSVIVRLTTDAATHHKYVNPQQIRSNVLQFINHGCHDCDANCALGPGGSGDLLMMTLKPIKKYEFLRWDYGIDDYEGDVGQEWLVQYWAEHDKIGKCAGGSRFAK